MVIQDHLIAARRLRKNQTDTERILWDIFRNRGFEDKRILRQHPIKVMVDGVQWFFVADFYCPEKKIVLEVDGSIHDKQEEYDQLRTMIINILGIKVFRIRNEEIDDMEKLKHKLRDVL